MSDKKYISPEHAIRNIMELKSVGHNVPTANAFFMKEEEELSEAGGVVTNKAPKQKPLTDKEKTGISNLPGDIDAAVRGAASSATFGAADHIAAGLDYAAKNYVGKPLGLSKGTTYEKEYQQELEKTEKAKKEHPTGYTVGEWIPVAAGGVKAGISAAAAAPAAIKAIPGAVKSFAKSYAKSSPLDVVKGVVKSAGGDFVKNPIKYTKELPSVAKGMAKLGAGTEIADKSVGLPEFGFGGQGWKQGAIYDKEKRKEMFSPGGATKTVQDVGKTAADWAAPGSVEAGKAAVKGDWDKAGREATRAVIGATVANPNFGRFVYDAAASAIAPQYSLTGDGGVSDKIYNKIKKIKENRENLNEGNAPLKRFFGDVAKEVIEKIAKPKKAPPKETPPSTEPGREGTPAKPGNDNTNPKNPNVTPLPPKWTKPIKPGKDIPPMLPPANPSPGAPKVPEFKPPPNMPKPVNVPPSPAKPAESPFPPPEYKPVPVKPVAPATPQVKPIPKELPAKKPAESPFPAPEYKPADKPKPAKETLPALKPAAKPEPVHNRPASEVANPEGKPRRVEEPKPKSEPKKEKGKEKGKLRFPFWFPGATPGQSVGIHQDSNVPVDIYMHRPKEYMTFEQTRYDIENVARPNSKDKTKVRSRQAEIIRKIIEEKKASKKNSTVIINPELKQQEPEQTK